MSTAIDDLRSMLDERGVKWKADTSVINGVVWTIWKSPWFGETWAKELDGSISLFNCSMTPAQAVEATLGRGTCEVVSKLLIEGEYVPAEYYEFEMECGEGFKWDESEPPRYCPNCGRKVVDA